jgi:undecaprenyl-diphosphatase
MVDYFQAVVLGLMQGLAELFPISSLGHTVILPALLRWDINESDPQFVAFVVLTHLATALVLLWFFWEDWLQILFGAWRTLKARHIAKDDTYGKLAWLIVVSTIPAGIVGLLFQDQVAAIFSSPKIIAIALTINGLVLYFGEMLRSRAPEGKADDSKIAALSWTEAVVVGIAQCFALIPGFSRTGLTMTAGLYRGLSHENAARYAFFLATPIILAASVLKVPDLFTNGAVALGPAIVGALCSAVSAFFSVKFLTKYFETKTLTPFAIYCVAVGVFSLLVFVSVF